MLAFGCFGLLLFVCGLCDFRALGLDLYIARLAVVFQGWQLGNLKKLKQCCFEFRKSLRIIIIFIYKSWDSAFVELWVSGFLDLWVSLLLDLWVSGFLELWSSGFL